MRLLDSEAGAVGLDELTFAPDVRAGFARALEASAGMILVSGPTGSGKSTTLYAAINHLASPMRNIVTVENPIEIQLPGITQTQVDVKAGVTFATVLRSMLRQDPDVILVGEMRDRETAGIAVEASQAGHLLLSTVHTNDAPSTITRLLDFDIDPFKITSSLVAVLGQRLVRRVCQDCAIDDQPEPRLLQELSTEVAQAGGPPRWRKGVGCPACHQSGYKGRMAILLVLDDDADMQQLLKLWLESDGHQVTVAGDGVEALLELGRQTFDLILSDIHMPNLDGLQLLELKTRKGVNVPIVVLSADGSNDTEQRALELGAMDFIHKPTKKDILLLRVQRILRQAAA